MHRIRNVIDRKASKNEKENFKKKVTELKVVILGDDTCIWGGCCSKRVHVYNREMEQDLKMEAHPLFPSTAPPKRATKPPNPSTETPPQKSSWSPSTTPAQIKKPN